MGKDIERDRQDRTYAQVPKVMDKCKLCPIKQCDWLDTRCRLSPKEIITQRRDLLTTPEKVVERWNGPKRSRKKPQLPYEARKAYFQKRYQDNREKFIEAAKARQRAYGTRAERRQMTMEML